MTSVTSTLNSTIIPPPANDQTVPIAIVVVLLFIIFLIIIIYCVISQRKRRRKAQKKQLMMINSTPKPSNNHTFQPKPQIPISQKVLLSDGGVKDKDHIEEELIVPTKEKNVRAHKPTSHRGEEEDQLGPIVSGPRAYPTRNQENKKWYDSKVIPFIDHSVEDLNKV